MQPLLHLVGILFPHIIVIQVSYNLVINVARYSPKLEHVRADRRTDDMEVIANFKFDLKPICQKKYLDLKYLFTVIKKNRHSDRGVDSASNRNDYQEYLPWGVGGKGGRCVGVKTLPSSCPDCLEILGATTAWSLEGLSRPV